MGQRVNIQYSVELEDLEQEVNRLYSNAITHLVSLPNASINLGTEGLDKVDSFRQKLAKVDIMLGDVQNIIEGYLRLKTQPATPQISQDGLGEEFPSDLAEKIDKLKGMLDAQSNQELEK